jgi:hypothetical protein
MRTPSVVELSDDGKMIRCNICEVLRGRHNSGWIQKESLAYHLKSEAHARSVRAQCDREQIQTAGERAMEEESVMEQRMDFVMLCPTAEPPAVTTPTRVLSTEEQDMWGNHALYNEHFDAGIDHAAAAVDERRRLERDANNFDLWHGADYLPEEDPNDGELLLEELEQDDILNELLRNARLLFHLH